MDLHRFVGGFTGPKVVRAKFPLVCSVARENFALQLRASVVRLAELAQHEAGVLLDVFAVRVPSRLVGLGPPTAAPICGFGASRFVTDTVSRQWS